MNIKKHICILQIFNDFSIGGVQHHITSLSTWLRNRGHSVLIAGSPGNQLSSEDYIFFTEIPLKDVVDNRMFSIKWLINFVRCVLQLRKLLITSKVELIHVHETAPAWVASLASLGLGIPIIFTCHGGPDWHYRNHARVCRFFVDHVIVVSKDSLERLCSLSVSQKKISLVRNGVEILPSLDNPHAAEECRLKLLGVEGRKLIITIARLHRQKGIDVLIKAAQMVIPKFPYVRFVVVGYGPEKNNLLKLIAESGLQELFFLVGDKSNPREYLEAADLFVLASRWEASPLSIPEAFRAGLPVIATDVGGVREMVDEHVGQLILPESPGQLAAAIIGFLQDDIRLSNASKAALKYGNHEQYKIDVAYSKIEQIYLGIVRSI
jgi:glycosyltransferase involved in cell wall biosynthesis